MIENFDSVLSIRSKLLANAKLRVLDVRTCNTIRTVEDELLVLDVRTRNIIRTAETLPPSVRGSFSQERYENNLVAQWRYGQDAKKILPEDVRRENAAGGPNQSQRNGTESWKKQGGLYGINSFLPREKK